MSMLPKSRRGRRSKAQSAEYQQQCLAFARELIELNTVVGFKMAVRDWCYYLEGAGAIDKSEFERGCKSNCVNGWFMSDRHPVSEEDNELIQCSFPVPNRHRPFF